MKHKVQKHGITDNRDLGSRQILGILRYKGSLPNTSTSASSTGSSSGNASSSVGTEIFHLTAYSDLTDEQLRNLAKLACQEQGSENKPGIAAELSIMANLFEIKKNGNYNGQTGGQGLYAYVRNGGWFANAASIMDSANGSSDNPVTQEAIDLAKDILANGNRTLPGYIDEHDSFGDITSISTGSVTDRSAYQKDVTVVKNRYGSTYTFYCFPGGDSGDPFGYTAEAKQKAGNGTGTSSSSSSSSQQKKADKMGAEIKYPIVTQVKNHWYYSDIDFLSNSYRLATSARKIISYEPKDEDDPLKEDNVQINSVIAAPGGIAYQVSDPEVAGPNKKLIDLLNKKYYKYDGTEETARKIQNAIAIENGEDKYQFNGEEYQVKYTYDNKGKDAINQDSSDSDKKKYTEQYKSYPNLSENELNTNGGSAFNLIKQVHTESAQYIYHDIRELVAYTDRNSDKTANDLLITEKQVCLWLIKTNDKTSTWQTKKVNKNYGTDITCKKNDTIICPSEAKIDKVSGDSVTLEFTDLTDDDIKLLEYVYKDKSIQFNKDAITGFKMKISGINVSGLSEGSAIKRGTELGKAKDEKINVIMYRPNKSVVEDLDNYMTQTENSKFEDNAREQMNNTKKGYNIGLASFLNSIGGGVSGTTSGNDFTGYEDDNAPSGYVSHLGEYPINGEEFNGDKNFEPGPPGQGWTDASLRGLASNPNYKSALQALMNDDGEGSFNLQAACAIMGCLHFESGMDPDAGHSGVDIGLVQWTYGRYNEFWAWANSNGYSNSLSKEEKIKLQIKYLKIEMKQKYQGVWNFLHEEGHSWEDYLYIYWERFEAGGSPGNQNTYIDHAPHTHYYYGGHESAYAQFNNRWNAARAFFHEYKNQVQSTN